MRRLFKSGILGVIVFALLITSGMKASGRQLTSDGPWLVFGTASADNSYDSNTVWAVDADGSNLRQLASGNTIRQITASPANHELAYIVAGGQNGPEHNPVLNVMALPSGESRAAINLTSPKTDPNPSSQDRNETIEAIVDHDNLAWSPDSKWLAFIGGQAGTSSDVYVYNDESRLVTQLTDGPTEAASPPSRLGSPSPGRWSSLFRCFSSDPASLLE